MRFQQSCRAGTREGSGILARQVWPVRPPGGCNRPSPFLSSFVVVLLCLCMLSAPHSVSAARIWIGDEFYEYIAEKYLEANLVIVGDIVSFVPRTIGESDSVAPDGWTYHRTTKVIVSDAIVDSVLKGDYGDSMITFQSMPYTEQGRSRLVRPSDSLHVMEVAEPVGCEEVPVRILQRGKQLLFLQSRDGTLVCTCHTRPNLSDLAVLRKVSTEGEDYLQENEPRQRPDEPELGSINIQKLAHDSEERTRLEPLIEQWQRWYGEHGSWEPGHFYGFRFSDTPAAGKQVHLNISAGPAYVPSGISVGWVVVPAGFEILAGEAIGTTDVGIVNTDEMWREKASKDEFWQRLDELRNEATVRFDLTLEAEEGVHVFKVYFVGKDDGRTQVGFEDYWVRVERDTAEVSGNEHFKKQSRSTTDIGIRVSPPEEKGPVHESRTSLTRRRPSLLDWAAVPVIEPIWLLKVDGDSAYVIKNGFVDSAASPSPPRHFPVPFARVSKEYTVEYSEGRFKGMSMLNRTLGYLPIQPDGTLLDQAVCWNLDRPKGRITERLGSSPLGKRILFARHGYTELCDGEGNVISVLPEKVKWSVCFDVPERIVAIAVQDLEDLSVLTQLSRILVLDYDGHVLYETDWTSCEVGNALMGWNRNVIWLTLEKCRRAGEYLLRVDEGSMHSLGAVPETGRRFSPDGCHVLVNEGGLFKFFKAAVPESLCLLWQQRIEGTISDVAVSDGSKFVAFRGNWDAGPVRHIYVVSGRDGRPACRLRWAKDKPTAAPFAFLGDYLFTGMGFAHIGTPWHTEFIYLYDLGDLPPAQ